MMQKTIGEIVRERPWKLRVELELFLRDFVAWCDDGQRTMQQLDRLQDRARDLVQPL